MIDYDGIERPDDPHAHMIHNKISATDREIQENYKFVNRNLLFRFWSRIFRRVVLMIMGPWLKHRYKLKIEGKKNIKLAKHKGCIVTVNHVHNFDNLLVGCKLLHHRKCYFITLKDNINMPFVGSLLRALGGIPIPTTRSAMPKFEESINMLLAQKKAIIVCPEASLWPYYRGIRPFKKGAFRFAVKNEVPVLPVIISFRRRIRKKSIRKGEIKYKYYFTIHVGEPIYPPLGATANERITLLQNQTYELYKTTTEKFYKDEEHIEEVQKAEFNMHLEKKQNNQNKNVNNN